MSGSAGPRIDVERLEISDGDVVLLCSNGLTDSVTESAIAAVLASERPPDEISALLLELAAAGEDDVTALVARYHGPAPALIVTVRIASPIGKGSCRLHLTRKPSEARWHESTIRSFTSDDVSRVAHEEQRERLRNDRSTNSTSCSLFDREAMKVRWLEMKPDGVARARHSTEDPTAALRT